VANLQPVRLIAVQSSEGLAKIGKGANLYGAPLADHLEPVNILAVGYADEEAADSKRHSQTRIPVEELRYRQAYAVTMK
jgi:nitroreductase